MYIHITSLICTVESHHGHSRTLSIFWSVYFLRVWLPCCNWLMRCFILHSSCYVMSNIAPIICDLLAKPAGRSYLFLCSHHTEELDCYVKRTKRMLFPREKSFCPFALVGRKKISDWKEVGIELGFPRKLLKDRRLSLKKTNIWLAQNLLYESGIQHVSEFPLRLINSSHNYSSSLQSLFQIMRRYHVSCC